MNYEYLNKNNFNHLQQNNHKDYGLNSSVPSKPEFNRVHQNVPHDFKKVYTYNIISNTPAPKVLPSRARIPYGYAISVDPGRLEALKQFDHERKSQNDGHGLTERKMSSGITAGNGYQ
mmetsp:Transcript_31068/g.28264  ORF Transcript_31068/g.28264 Transcript_31068/m.28264 type:complete len:118 (-) Transcript_31068:242-595(-)|eukprot:CAMPEP_0114577956 /NCGR_PEP_ID=MMETSP0125-20121206/2564_1 /TAXON_ID=485358 ORGANISM="Aristerostoma sp., Strain ATCC 50986" /NCGR_SAMPLE_ID=MMETSP0125 /ASSEMBLY_ACC=CAM_ASM_000245 /LENGTH=117 /DNA_ID=CAMNT_0001767681 /DNA_START=437 /DNA_END=790 /DNA_ORIENTATION=+